MFLMKQRLRALDCESGFTMAEVMVSLIITGIVGVMGTSLLVSQLDFQHVFMKRQVQIEVTNVSAMISNINFWKPDATPLEMRQRLLPTSQIGTQFEVHGGMKDYVVYVKSDMFDTCYKLTPEAPDGYKVECATVVDQPPLSQVIAEDEATKK